MKENDGNTRSRYRLRNERFVCVGFVFITGRPNFTDPEDYLDYRQMRWDKETMEKDLRRGVLPPGMLIKAESGTKIGMVVGHYDYPQKVEVLGDLENMIETVGRMVK
ncbi:MAG TPA: hypothetical protein PLR56_09165 [Brevefilum sp.]|jgi:hypothetical protein|nr:hypothetical protein [Brevefilum sp.]